MNAMTVQVNFEEDTIASPGTVMNPDTAFNVNITTSISDKPTWLQSQCKLHKWIIQWKKLFSRINIDVTYPDFFLKVKNYVYQE